VRFADLAATSAAVAATSARRTKVELLAGALRSLAGGADNCAGPPDPVDLSLAPAGQGGDPADWTPAVDDLTGPRGDPVADESEARVIAAGSAYLAGELRQRQTGVGWASLRGMPEPAEIATLDVATVDATLQAIADLSGSGSQAQRRRLLDRLFAAATADEQRMLRGLLTGELRQGAQAGLLVDAIARAAGVDASRVRRALLLAGDLKRVAVAALTRGAAGLAEFRLTVGQPLAPMLAQSAPSVEEALAATGSPAAADVKLDGVRIQVHRDGGDVAVFSRSLDDITARMPGVVADVRDLPVRSAVLDGEAIGLDLGGRPLPFQETSSRAARRTGVPPSALRPFFFDLLHLDGVDLLDAPALQRWAALSAALPPALLVGRAQVADGSQARRAFETAVDAGHEGLVIKAANAPYDVGRRGAAWIKVKPRHTLDLVVLAAEWGHGRRRGWLSNLHLGARDPAGGEFVMLGKTFKGMTDEMLRWQTERLLGLAVERNEWLVRVRPELVVEIAFDGVQNSRRYPGGVALRFARVLRYREDKTAAQADTIDTVLSIYSGH
jgi:DNA ligase-1